MIFLERDAADKDIQGLLWNRDFHLESNRPQCHTQTRLTTVGFSIANKMELLSQVLSHLLQTPDQLVH
jgi:hypothetical protein